LVITLLVCPGVSLGASETEFLQHAVRFAQLGDAVHTDHYFFLADYLRKNRGTKKEAKTVARLEKEVAAAAEKGEIMKPPSASIGELEFSHLIGAVARDNGLLGAAVFDLHGLKVGYWGIQVDPVVIPKSMVKQTLSNNDDENPVHKKLLCTEEQRTKLGCKSDLHIIYRPIASDRTGKRFGISACVVDETFGNGQSGPQ